VLATYIIASWWAWWFGGAFGHRCFVEYISLLVLPFAELIKNILSNRKYLPAFAVLVILFCFYNVRLTYAYQPPWDGPKWTYNNVLKEVEKAFWIR
jgi:hypothetical protein